MVSYEEFHFDDLFTMNAVNFDQLTETYSNAFYGQYLTQWPEYQTTARHPCGLLMGYILGKAEGEKEDWHGHVSAVTVAPQFRRIGLGDALMRQLESTTATIHNAYFVDLFVRASNAVAANMYTKMGYVVYRRVLGYYSKGQGPLAEEDALDMRKAMPRDKQRSKSSCIPLTKPIRPDELEWH